MAVKTSYGNGKKIILLLLFIIVLLGAGILLIDFTSTLFGIHFPLPGLKYIKQIKFKKKVTQIEDKLLLEKEELSKDKERLSLKEEEINIREKELELKVANTKKKLELLKEKEKELEKNEKMLENKKQKYKDRQDNIREQALKLYNMPPNDAAILIERQSEADIIDILRAIDSYSEELGRQSTSPYMMKLLGDINKEKAANVLRKFKYSAGKKDTAVEILKEIESEEPPQP